MMNRAVILAPDVLAPALTAAARRGNPAVRAVHVREAADLDRAAAGADASSVLVSCGTSVIVPGNILSRFGAAVNIHAASPDYPGRDPHHFAVYEAARRYGATAHVMTDRVDAGPIVGLELFDVPARATPVDLLARANEAAMRLADDLIPRLVRGEALAELDVQWAGSKRTRSDFRRLCRLSPLADAEEFVRRRDAVAFPGRANLHVDLHGHRFRLEGPVPENDMDYAHWQGFTEAAYAGLLDAARARYGFVDFTAPGDGAHVLWRHDIDFSVHRAARLAEIERDKNATATYFFMLHSAFYTLTDPAVLDRARRIVALGHRAGLHFDPAAYRGESWTQASLERRMATERARLAELLGCAVEAVSFHNPADSGFMAMDAAVLAGMVNAYGRPLREAYTYCSDSNGYWRYEPLPDLIASGKHPRLQALTHPAWWTPEPLPPRARIERCVLGRAQAAMQNYDAFLARHGRLNIDR